MFRAQMRTKHKTVAVSSGFLTRVPSLSWQMTRQVVYRAGQLDGKGEGEDLVDMAHRASIRLKKAAGFVA